jgi:hypothetical protein
LDLNETESESKLGRCTTSARGPFGLGQISRLLTRRQASRVRLRQDNPALGRCDGSGAADARGPFRLGRISRLFTRWEVSSDRLKRQDN